MNFLGGSPLRRCGRSHPTALLLNHDDSRLFWPYESEIDALDTKTGKVVIRFPRNCRAKIWVA